MVGARDPRLTGKFLEWIAADVRKESAAALEASGLTFAQVDRAIRARARAWCRRRRGVSAVSPRDRQRYLFVRSAILLRIASASSGWTTADDRSPQYLEAVEEVALELRLVGGVRHGARVIEGLERLLLVLRPLLELGQRPLAGGGSP